MVERKIRPAPLTLVARKSVKPAGKPGATPRIGLAQKLFVLDTNVLMHDPTSLFRFEEHDIYLPMLTLEELDNNKKGVTEVARNARQASRFLDELVSAMTDNITEGISLEAKSGGAATGKLYLQTDGITTVLPASLANGKADNQILAVVMHLQHLHVKRHVVLVTKDINMRIKARALGIAAEDYFNDKVLEDTELLYSGMTELPAISGTSTERAWSRGSRAAARTTGSRVRSFRRFSSTNSSTTSAGRSAAARTRQGDQRPYRGAADAQGLHAPEEQRLGDHRAQSRAELRAQPVDESRHRLRDASRAGGDGQDAAHARRGSHADARIQGLFGDHHDARHGAVGEDIGFLPAPKRRR
jgi:hypothetical protein